MSALTIATAAWNNTVPDWVAILAEQCDRTTQREVAEAIGYSPSVVNQVIQASYKGSLKRVKSAVEGAFMGSVVACPVLGDLPQQDCLRHQRQPFNPSNPMRVRLYRACHTTCPYRFNKAEEPTT